MDKSKEREFVCKFCNKKFPSGKSLGGHIRIHNNEYSVDSYSYNGNRLREIKKRSMGQREMMAMKQQRQLCCKECGKGFDSFKALSAHMDCHSEVEKMVMDIQSDTEISSVPTRKRSKRVMKQSRDSKGHNLVVNSLAESSENNSVILETKSSSGEQLKKIFNVKNRVLATDKVAMDDQYRFADDYDYDHDNDNCAVLCDSDSSDSDYFMNGPKKSDSDISIDGSLRNTGFGSRSNRFRNSDELGFKDGGSNYKLRKSKRFFPTYENGAHSLETESCADRNSKNHRLIDSKSPMVKKASGGSKKKRKGHECPICSKVFKSGQALGGHKRSHSIENQEHRVKHQAAEMQIDLNLPAPDIDE